MIIEKPEGTDLYFKKKLIQLPVDYNEADWENLDKLLEQSKPVGKIKKGGIATGKLIVIVSVLGLIAASILLWLHYKAPLENNLIRKNDNERIVFEKDSLAPVVVPNSSVIEGQQEKAAPVKDKTLKKETLKKMEPIVKDTIKEVEGNKDIFW